MYKFISAYPVVLREIVRASAVWFSEVLHLTKNVQDTLSRLQYCVLLINRARSVGVTFARCRNDLETVTFTTCHFSCGHVCF